MLEQLTITDLNAATGQETVEPTLMPDGFTVLVGSVFGEALTSVFASMEWAEEEIGKARVRHPKHADRIFHSFTLLCPPDDRRMATELVYRSHCRELLDRVAAGDDTRPGTVAEVCCAMAEASLATPLTSSATGLYMRMWRIAGFPEFAEFTEALIHHEALEHAVIDNHEQFTRRELAVADRAVDDIDCAGFHHGAEVSCVFAAGQTALEF
jgi:hypothetical protein